MLGHSVSLDIELVERRKGQMYVCCRHDGVTQDWRREVKQLDAAHARELRKKCSRETPTDRHASKAAVAIPPQKLL
jgi:hypothetical protein